MTDSFIGVWLEIATSVYALATLALACVASKASERAVALAPIIERRTKLPDRVRSF